MKFLIVFVLIAAVTADFYPAIQQDKFIPAAPVLPIYGIPNADVPKTYITSKSSSDNVKNEFIESEKTLTFKTNTPEQNFKYVVPKAVVNNYEVPRQRNDFEVPKQHNEYRVPAQRISTYTPQSDDIVHSDVYETDKTLTFKTNSLNQNYQYTVPLSRNGGETDGGVYFPETITYNKPHSDYGIPTAPIIVHDIPHSLDLPTNYGNTPSGPAHLPTTRFDHPIPVQQHLPTFTKIDIPTAVHNPQHTIELPVDSSISVIDDHNQYTHGFSLSDGTKVSEQGKLISTDDGWEYVVAKKGYYEYISPEGLEVKVNWIADENGFRILE